MIVSTFGPHTQRHTDAIFRDFTKEDSDDSLQS